MTAHERMTIAIRRVENERELVALVTATALVRNLG
jgi:hypothetical protein